MPIEYTPMNANPPCDRKAYVLALAGFVLATFVLILSMFVRADMRFHEAQEQTQGAQP